MTEYQKRIIELAETLINEAKRDDFEGSTIGDLVAQLAEHIDTPADDFEDQSEEATITRAEIQN